MNDFKKFIGENMYFKLNGDNNFTGRLIDAGNDLIVIFDGTSFIYVSLYHVQYFRHLNNNETSIEKPERESIIRDDIASSISLRKILTAAKGIFVEVFVTGKKTIHGYIRSVMNDYCVFYSPVYKTIYISLKHIKWIIPYRESATPYSLDREQLHVSELNVQLARTLEEQLKKSLGSIIILNLGDEDNKIGKLIKVENGQVEMALARANKSYLNLNHIQTINFP